jgi:hypothetical protein
MILVAVTALKSFAALPPDGLVPVGGFVEVKEDGQSGAADLAVAGTLEKRGSGELVLTNLLSRPGTISVQEGRLTLVESGLPETLPAALQSGLALWVDANTNVVATGAAVDRWLDVREADTTAPYAYMRAEHDFTFYPESGRARKPSLMTGGIDVNGLEMVDFGTFGETNTTAAWLPWRKADGTRGVLTTIKAIFAVASFPDSNGFIFGDWDYTDAGGPTGVSGTWDFWLGDEIIFKKHYRFLNPGKEDYKAYKSDIYFNGVQKAPDQIPGPLGQVIEITSPVGLTAANFFNGRNMTAVFPLFGGGRLGEVLIYTNAVNEAQRLAVESYLMRKWKSGGQVGGQRVAAGATLVTDASAGTDLKVAGVRGSGLWSKTGAGTVSLTEGAALNYGSIRLEEGVLDDTGLVRRPNHLFDVPEQGLIVNAGGTSWNVTSTATTNALIKSGSGELTVAGFPQSIKSVVVEQGTLRLTQALVDPE